MFNSKTTDFQLCETYPSIKPAVSRCCTQLSTKCLTDALRNDVRSRFFDMERDDIVEVWRNSPNKDTLSYYGVGSDIPKPEAVVFNRLVTKCLNKAGVRPPNSTLPKSAAIADKSGDHQAEARGSLVLNRVLLKAKISKMPTVQETLDASRALSWLHYPPLLKRTCLPRKTHISLKSALDMERLSTKIKVRAKHTQISTLPKYEVNRSTYEDIFKREIEQLEIELQAEPKDSDELFSQLVSCFEKTSIKDPITDKYECCKRISRRGGLNGFGRAINIGDGGGGDGAKHKDDYGQSPQTSKYGPGADTGDAIGVTYADGGAKEEPGSASGMTGGKDGGNTAKKEGEGGGDATDGDGFGNEFGKERGNELGKDLGNKLGNKVGSRVGSKDGNKVGNELEDIFEDKSRDKLGDKLADQHGDKLGDKPGDKPGDANATGPATGAGVDKKAAKPGKKLKDKEKPAQEKKLYEFPKDFESTAPTPHQSTATSIFQENNEKRKTEKEKVTKRKKTKKMPIHLVAEVKEPIKDCPCEICICIKGREHEPDSALIRQMKKQQERRDLLDYYKRKCHQEYLERRKPQYCAPQHKCDPIKCDNGWFRLLKIDKNLERLEALHELQKMLGCNRCKIDFELMYKVKALRDRLRWRVSGVF